MAFTAQEIKDYIEAVQYDPVAIAQTAGKFNVSMDDIASAMGYDTGQVIDYLKTGLQKVGMDVYFDGGEQQGESGPSTYTPMTINSFSRQVDGSKRKYEAFSPDMQSRGIIDNGSLGSQIFRDLSPIITMAVPFAGAELASLLGVSTATGTALVNAGMQVAQGGDAKSVLTGLVSSQLSQAVSPMVASELQSLVSDPTTAKLITNIGTSVVNSALTGNTSNLGKTILGSAVDTLVGDQTGNSTLGNVLGAAVTGGGQGAANTLAGIVGSSGSSGSTAPTIDTYPETNDDLISILAGKPSNSSITASTDTQSLLDILGDSSNQIISDAPFVAAPETQVTTPDTQAAAQRIPPDYSKRSFNSAFAAARLLGEPDFTWKGQTFTTELASKPTYDSVGGGRGGQGGPTAEQLAAYTPPLGINDISASPLGAKNKSTETGPGPYPPMTGTFKQASSDQVGKFSNIGAPGSVEGRYRNLPTFDPINRPGNYINRFIDAVETGGFMNPNWGLYKPGVQIMASDQPNTTNYDSAAAAYVPVGEYPGTKGTVMLTDSGPYKYSPAEAANLLSHELVHVNQPLGTLNEASNHFIKGMSKDITSVIPYLQKQYGYWGGYDNAKNTPELKERMADLQGFQFNQGIDFAKDPVFKEKVLSDPHAAAMWNANTIERSTRLDAKDLPPGKITSSDYPKGNVPWTSQIGDAVQNFVYPNRRVNQPLNLTSIRPRGYAAGGLAGGGLTQSQAQALETAYAAGDISTVNQLLSSGITAEDIKSFWGFTDADIAGLSGAGIKFTQPTNTLTDTSNITDTTKTTANDFLNLVSPPASNITSTGGVTKSATAPTSGGVSKVIEGDDIETQIAQLPQEYASWQSSVVPGYSDFIRKSDGAVLQRTKNNSFSDLDLLKIGLSFVPGAGPILAALNIAGAVKSGDWVQAAIGATGFVPGMQNVNTALKVGQAVDQNNPFGAVTALAGNTDVQNLLGLGNVNVGGFTAKDVMAAGSLAQAATTGNYAGVLTNLGTLTGSADTTLAGRALSLYNRLQNGDTRALIDAINLSNSISGNKATTTGTTTADAGTDTTLPTGLQLASTGDGVFRTDVGGVPTYAESSNASTVKTPLGYTLLSMAESDDKPPGSYYDITANAWFKPSTELTDLSGNANILADAALFNNSLGTLDKLDSTRSANDFAAFLATIGITNPTQLADSGLSNQDILDLINASTLGGTTGLDGTAGTGTTGTGTGGTGPGGTGPGGTGPGGTGPGGTGTDGTGPGGTTDCGPGFHDDGTGFCVPDDDEIICPPGKVLNDEGTACIDETIIVAPRNPCPPGTKYDEDLDACMPITTECAPGFHDDGTGLCVPDDEKCSDGYHLENGTCVPDDCPEGYVRDLETGQCVPADEPCKPGFHKDESGVCVPDEEEPCKAGYHRDASGVCVPDEAEPCKDGYHRNAAGVCVPDDDKPCADGFHRDEATGLCVPDDDEECKDGYEKVNGVCEPVCKEGYIRNLETGICEKADTSCPAGQTKNADGKCVPIVVTPTNCQPGYEKVNGVCVPMCQPGYRRVNGVCKKITTDITVPTSALGASGEKTDPIYAGGMDEFNLLATLQELLKDEPAKKADNKSTDKTKMATGGHLDDLLAEQMTVDDLLKLLR